MATIAANLTALAAQPLSPQKKQRLRGEIADLARYKQRAKMVATQGGTAVAGQGTAEA